MNFFFGVDEMGCMNNLDQDECDEWVLITRTCFVENTINNLLCPIALGT